MKTIIYLLLPVLPGHLLPLLCSHAPPAVRLLDGPLVNLVAAEDDGDPFLGHILHDTVTYS